jgi:hypothetical protein
MHNFWKDISRCTKAFQLLADTYHIDSSELRESHQTISLEKIYAFLDNNGVYVFPFPCMTTKNFGEEPCEFKGFGYNIYYGEKNKMKHTLSEIDKPYELRQDAQLDALKSAFEILNENL